MALAEDAAAQPLQQALEDLEWAYTNFLGKRAEFPRFKKKGRHNSWAWEDVE